MIRILSEASEGRMIGILGEASGGHGRHRDSLIVELPGESKPFMGS